jgi:adenylate cyclase class 2
LAVGVGKNMANETEIKLRVADVNAFQARLARLGARCVFAGSASGRSGRVHEWNVVFDTPGGALRSQGQLLRIRVETPKRSGTRRDTRKRKEIAKRVLLTFKRPPRRGNKTESRRRHKVREEIELEVTDAEALTKIFERLGMRRWFGYEKFRTTYRLPESQRWARGLLIELDETPIGTFVELEGPAKAIDRAAKALGFDEKDYVVSNYLSMYRQECARLGKRAGDMVFQK